MQIPILAGREIDECDKPGSPLVAVVNENLLKTLRVRIRSEDGLDSGMATRTISKSSVSQGTQVYNQSQPNLNHQMFFELRKIVREDWVHHTPSSISAMRVRL